MVQLSKEDGEIADCWLVLRTLLKLSVHIFFKILYPYIKILHRAPDKLLGLLGIFAIPNCVLAKTIAYFFTPHFL